MKFLTKMYVWLTTPFYYRKIKKMKTEGEIVIVLVDKFGDSCYGMMYARELKKETGKKITVFCSERLKNLVEEYDCVDKILTYPSDYYHVTRTFALVGFNAFFGSKKNDGVIIINPAPDHHPGLNVKEIYRDDIFKVKHDNFQLFRYSNPPKVTSIENFDQIKSKVVVVNPYAKSIAKNGEKIMQKIANMLVKNGFEVFTNVVGQQDALKGTKPLNCPPDELFSICQECHAFVSLRSGIADLMLSTKCKKFIVYAKNKRYRMEHSLKNYAMHNVEEYFVKDEKHTEKLVKVAEDFVCFQK